MSYGHALISEILRYIILNWKYLDDFKEHSMLYILVGIPMLDIQT